MTILSFINISNIDNLNCDSGYIFQTILGNTLIESGHNFVLVIPIKPDSSQINFHLHDFGQNKFQVRFSFDWQKINEIISAVNPDIIISNQPELSSNLKALIISESLNAKLYTYIHYYPFSISNSKQITYDSSLNNSNFCNSIIFTFIAGLLASDRIFVHSNYGKILLESLFHHHNIKLDTKDIFILPPPFDDFISKGKIVEGYNNILYNHRLYKQYGTQFLIDFANSISEEYNWKIVVTDILPNRNKSRKTLDSTVDDFKRKLSILTNVDIRTDGNNREIYRNIICTSKISLAPFRQNCTWSMSVIDCMCVGVPVIAPNFAWFNEFIPKELLFNSLHELKQITKQLFTDKSFYEDISHKVRDKIDKDEKLNKKNIVSCFNF